MALDEKERELADWLFRCGVIGLLERGMSVAQAMEFSSLTYVREYLELLAAEFKSQDDQLARHKFMAKRDLTRLMPTALRVLRDAMGGIEYVRGADGGIAVDAMGDYIVKDAGVSKVQLAAARDVLDRLGVEPEAQSLRLELDLKKLLNQSEAFPVHINYPADANTEEQRALSRERRRHVLQFLEPVIVETVAQEAKAAATAKAKATKKLPAGVIGKFKKVKKK